MTAEQQIRFDDGDAYERMMGIWSRLAGGMFLDWLAPRPGLRWIDVGCGSGAFTELVVERCAPASVRGVDPSEAQLAFARRRPAARIAEFSPGDAMALPASAATFDVAVMALVIFFVPDPARGVAEMVRVVAPGGTVAAYAWDILGGGLPTEPIQAELRAMGQPPIFPPRPEAGSMEILRELWARQGLEEIGTREIVVSRRFADFEDYWATNLLGPSLSQKVATMTAGDVDRLKRGVRARLPADAAGGIVYAARANAIRGRKPQ